MEIGQSAGKSFAYILGVYLGDGNVSRHKNVHGYRNSIFRVNTIDEDFAQSVKEAWKIVTGRDAYVRKEEVKKSSNPNYSLQVSGEELCTKLVVDTHGKLFIPEYVDGWDKSRKLAFIAGLMDSEGFVSKKYGSEKTYYMGFKCCEPWVRDFARLLVSVGVKVGKIVDCEPYRSHYRTPTRFHIKVQSWHEAGAYFKIQRKQNRVLMWLEQRLSSTTNMLDAA